jgi:tRNA modification GTPase
VIEVSMDMAGLPVIFTDTAGLREGSTDEIEQIGMERSRREIAEADIVIWMTAKDSEQEPDARIDSKAIWVDNKADLPESSLRLFRNDPDYRVSVKSGDGMAALLNELKIRIESAFGGTEPALIVRARQRECTETLLERLKSAQTQPATSLELVAEDLRAAADALGRLTGKINVEDILGEIFSEFCIGK